MRTMTVLAPLELSRVSPTIDTGYPLDFLMFHSDYQYMCFLSFSCDSLSHLSQSHSPISVIPFLYDCPGGYLISDECLSMALRDHPHLFGFVSHRCSG